MNLRDQPGRRDPIHVYALARDPRPSLQPAQRLLVTDHGFLPTEIERGLGQPCFKGHERSLGGLAAVGAEEVDLDDLGQLPAQPRELSLTLGPLIRLRGELIGESPGFTGDGVVVGVARRVEHGAYLLVGEPVDEARLAQRRFAAARDDLLHQPAEILLGLLAQRQSIHRALHRHGAHGLQPAPDLDAEIRRLRRQLMDQQQPRRPRCYGRLLMHDTYVSFHH